MTIPTEPAPKRRNYTPEYRQQVVELMLKEKRGVASLARELGIGESLLHTWRARALEKGVDSTLLPSKKPLVTGDGAAEIAALRQENARLREERDILKKSVAIFIGTRK
jgi:transposase